MLTSEHGDAAGSPYDRQWLSRKGPSEILQMTAGRLFPLPVTGRACEAHPDPAPVRTTPRRCPETDSTPPVRPAGVLTRLPQTRHMRGHARPISHPEET
ncbi:hypothetical protein Psuf_053840 [Phytohabitans suffuscus]|uniref:Uncharacterized protein n=1 Tax=Phytohabitans suffuscus TaxID=624315 RepID=A0A6F8YQ65_9ACTN|nr:hypothetical protein Psuf_053840 [Phytohabitans suffuscus]